MADENTTDSLASDAPDLPPEPIPLVGATAEESSAPDLPQESATPSTKTNAEKSSAPNLSQATAKVTPPAPIDTGKHKECRSEPRIHVRWHADVFIDGQGGCRGFVKGISLKGTDIFLEHSLQDVKFVKLHIHVPPLLVTSDHHVMEVSGKVIYTAYDSNEFLFHTGVNFLQFNLKSDLAYLQSRIANY